MATNITQRSVPYYWSSANDDVIYQFDFKPLLIDGIGDESGSAYIQLFNVFDVSPRPGEFIFVDSPSYRGTFKIKDVFSSSIVVLDTAYVGTIPQNTYNCYHLRTPSFIMYKGFKPGEQYDSDLPYTKVVDIKPSVFYDTTGFPYLEINIMGLTKYIFKIIPNTIANSIDFSMFNGVRLEWDGLTTTSSTSNEWTLVLNSAISNQELIFDKIAYGKFLYPINKPLIYKTGVSFACKIYTDVPILIKFINGIQQ